MGTRPVPDPRPRPQMPLALGVSRLALLRKCVETIETFDPKRTTVDAWVEDAEALKDKQLAEVEVKFIHQVFYGCNRYQKFLKLFVTSFMYKCPSTAQRTEQTQYMVLAYLLFFRLQELGVAEFRLFLSSGFASATALLDMLRFALSPEDLEKWVKMEWCKVFDVAYVENEIINKLQCFAPELQPLVDEVEFRATGSISSAEGAAPAKEKRRISPKPFNLTQPKPRLIPEPEVISREYKARPLPPPKPGLAVIEEDKKQRLEDEKARLAEKYNATDFQMSKTTNRDRDEKAKKEVEEAALRECTFAPEVQGMDYKRPLREAPVRATAAAVLREDALLKQKQAKEFQLLKDYERGLHDASEYNRWQTEMKEKDQQEEELRVQRRAVEMQLARDGAMEATESERRKKNIVAQAQRAEMKAQEEVRAQEDEAIFAEKQQFVEKVQQERENTRAAEASALKARADAAEAVRLELQAEAEKKKREDELEMERRKDIIRQIRAIERVPVERVKQLDPSEQPCQGLLEEMSLAELRDRLKFEEARRAKEVEDKRAMQLQKKAEKQKELDEKTETLAKIRERAKAEASERREQAERKQQEQKELAARHRDKLTEEVAMKIQLNKQKKREEELRLRKELKDIAAKRQFLVADARKVEAQMHQNMHLGLEREAKARQLALLEEQKNDLLIHARDASQRALNRQRDQDDYRTMQADADARVRRAKSADTAIKEDIAKSASMARAAQKNHERKLAADIGHGSSKYTRRLPA